MATKIFPKRPTGRSVINFMVDIVINKKANTTKTMTMVSMTQNLVWAVSQKTKGIGSSYLMETLQVRCATSWSYLDITFGLTVVTPTFKILSGLYIRDHKV